MTWLRDYVYIPLGGSRAGQWRTFSNTVIVFFISGLWHGANWTFVCWGLYHGVLLTIYNLLGINTKKNGIISEGRFFPTIKEFLQICLTFFLAVIGWIIFRSNNLTEALSFITRMLSTMFIPSKVQCGNGLIYLTMGFAMLFIEWLQRDKQHALQLPNIYIFKFKAVRWSLYAGILVMMMMFTGQSQQFIYFQF
jgi:D-alanyl-lipoteichoic acid acyltransferase DltB (MBOAT superfamily)